MALPDYKYEPLPSADTHIRLLKVSPFPPDGSITCTLTTVPMAQANEDYDAISYTWGPENPVREISVNGQRLVLRENIWHFLHQYSSTELGQKHHRNLWIDSICINQNDGPEKNVQVQQMSSIFTRAKQVIVWLGDASNESTWASINNGQYARMVEFMREAYYRPAFDDATDEIVKADIRRLMTASYWTRLWVVQELALAQQVSVVSGELLFDLGAFVDFADMAPYYFQKKGTNDPDSAWRSAAKQVDQLVKRHLYREGTSAYHGLAPLVASFAAQECYDRHDRVYGLVGLAESRKTLTVDYKLDMEVLFWQVLQFTHAEISDMAAGARRDSYQWNLDALLHVLGLQLEDILKHKTLQRDIAQDRFAVETKINGDVKLPPGSSVPTGSPFVSFTVRRYYWGELCLLAREGLKDVKLGFVYDPLLLGFSDFYEDDSVEVRLLDAPQTMVQDFVTSLRDQSVTEESAREMRDSNSALSLRVSFGSLVELCRLENLGDEYFQGERNAKNEPIGRLKVWPNGFPWGELVGKAEDILKIYPSSVGP